MRVLLITNPNSTSQDGSVMRTVFPHLKRVPGAEYFVRFTQYAGHAEEIVREVSSDDYDVVLAVGGDGTVNEVINGLLGAPGDAVDPATLPLLGVIPTGSANVFARALGLPSIPADAAKKLAQLMEEGQQRTIRLGVWETPQDGQKRWFAVNAGFGIDADVLAAVDKKRAKGHSATPARYLWMTLRAWYKTWNNPPRIKVKATDGTKKLELNGVPLLFASNTNPWTFLGPLPVVTNPRNSFDKGLGLFGVRSLDGFSGFAAMLHIFGASKAANHQVITFDDAQEVDLQVPSLHRFQADGEVVGKYEHIRLTSVAHAIEVIAP